MKRFLVILLCLSSCLFFGPEAVNAAPHVASPLYSGHIPNTAGAVGTAAVKAENISAPGAKQKTDAELHHAARPKEPSSPQSFMDPELLALLLLIMVLGMLYASPSR